MKPKWQPIAFPQECAPYGEQAIQPLVLPDNAIVVAGGPSALFLFQMFEISKLSWTITARDRITGFAAHGSELYVQDGPVLSRWSLVTGECASAINLLAPGQRWTAGSGALDWTALHKLPDAMRAKQQALARARRRAEWAALLTDAEQEHLMLMQLPHSLRPAAVIAQLEPMINDLKTLLGPGGGSAARGDLAKAMDDAAALVFSAPVVRTHQIWGKAAGMVFVIGRDATLHPLDDTLKHMGSKRIHRAAQPALALAEFATDADSDEFACRLYYVAGDGTVQALDGGALPLAALSSWTARGPADLEARVRPRVVGDVLWAGGAQGTGVFALTVDRPGEPSRVTLPDGDWRWLEVRPDVPLALASTADQARLIAHGKGTRTIDRWGKRTGVPPCFTTFLPQSSAPAPSGRPLLVLEVNRELWGGEPDLAFRVLVANAVDAPDAASAAWYPPAPAVLIGGTLQGWGDASGLAPKTVRTQPSVSRQDAYVIARDRTRSQQFQAWLGPDGPGSWRKHYDAIKQRYPDPAAASAALGETALPPIPGRDAIYCYALGNTITSEQAERAWRALDELRDLAKPVRLRIMITHRWMYAGDKHWNQDGPAPLRSRGVTLRFGNGKVMGAGTDGDGWIALPPEASGETVTMDPLRGGNVGVSTCRLDRYGNNQVDQSSTSIE
jgi:hypothetical protein